jgi:hypothetical protein
MNLSTSLALYAIVNKELSGELEFPGSQFFYTSFDTFTYAPLHADFQLWAALEPKCGNEAFNVHNGDIESWSNMWPKLAKHFGCKVPANQFERPTPGSSRMELHENPPLQDYYESAGLESAVSRGVVEQRIDLVKWSQKPEVKAAWEKIAERDGLEKDAFEKATWDFLGFVLGRNYPIVISASKARAFGFNGYIDSWQSFVQTFEELEKLKIVPKVNRF